MKKMNAIGIGLVDTNILVYAYDEGSIFHRQALSFLDQCVPTNNLFIAVQNLVEFYATVTSTKRVLKPIPKEYCVRKIQEIIESGHFTIVTEGEKTALTAVQLLKKALVLGQDVHDLHLAAVMMDNGIDTIYTADTKIFSKLGLRAINPLK